MKKTLLAIAVWTLFSMSVMAAEPQKSEECLAVTDVETVALVDIDELSEITCQLEGSSIYDYTGKSIKPVITGISYIDENGKFAEKTADEFRIVKYKNNVKVGHADVEISIDGYKGTIVVKDVFEIKYGTVHSFKTSPYSYQKIKLTWDRVPKASGYYIYRSMKKGERGSNIRTISGGDTTSYYNTSVKIGKTYYYTIRPYFYVNGVKKYGEYSEQLKQRAQVADGKITTVKRSTYKSIKVEWKKIYGASGYILYRSTEEDGEYTKISAVKGGSVLSYIDKNCVCGQTYYYKVKAYRKVDGVSHYGNQSQALSARTTPSKVEFGSGTYSGITSVRLYWSKSDGATGYKIYRSTSYDSGYELIQKIEDADVLNYRDENLEDGIVYYYRMRPYVEFEGEDIHGAYSAKYKKNVKKAKIEELKKYIYVKYVSGGKDTNGWDCSGFAQWAMRFLFEIEIPRSSAEQSKGGVKIDKDDMSTWEAGDLLFYKADGKINHVAVYLGNGRLMHALNSKYGTLIQDVDYYEQWDKKNNLSTVKRYH